MDFRLKVLRLEQTINELPAEKQIKPDVTHFFEEVDGKPVYGRAMLIPAGATIVGRIHRHAHWNHIHFGSILVATEFGTKHFTGEYDFISQPGTKRVVHAIEDTLWITYHDNPTDTRDVLQLEAEIIAPSYAALGMSVPEKLE